MSEPQSFLARHQPKAGISEYEMRTFARNAWLERGIPVFLSLDEIPDFEAQTIRNAAVKLYGKRNNA